MGIELISSRRKVQLLNVYLPYNCDDNIDEYKYYIAKIDSIITGYASPYIYVIGDFNAHVSSDSPPNRHKFGSELQSFCEDENYILSDVEYLKNITGDVFTYVSDAHTTVSWLDHVMTTFNGHSLIKTVSIDYSFVTSDHRPLSVDIDFNKIITEYCSDNKGCFVNGRVKWDEMINREVYWALSL